MNVIFLDIDGVLNFVPENKNERDSLTAKQMYGLNQEKVDILSELIRKTKYSIVISSSWRLFDDHPYYSDWRKSLVSMLNLGYDPIVDYTEDCYKTIFDPMERAEALIRKRGIEIKRWIESHDVDNFVVIDDDTYDIITDVDESKVIKINNRKGLTKEDIKKIMEIMKND